MRVLSTNEITQAIAKLCIQANHSLPPDVSEALQIAAQEESWPPAKHNLNILLQNLKAAKNCQLPICQDTGMACVFIELGQEVQLVGGSLQQAVQNGVSQGYTQGLLRKSMVGDPLRRQNTGDNSPAQLSLSMVPGAAVRIVLAPKGFGSENMSRLVMLPPAAGVQGVEDFILETVCIAAANACPPVVVGVGIGAGFDGVALLAKKALLRPLTQPNSDPWYAQMEQRLLKKINQTGIGTAGYGGAITALGLAIEVAATHIAGLPCAVNLSCHATRRAQVIL